jgi:hypothetical protein
MSVRLIGTQIKFHFIHNKSWPCGDHSADAALENASRSLPVIDGLLAATAKIHRMTLVTRNTPDIPNLGVHILNPFELK